MLVGINVDTTVWPFLSTHHISVQTCGQEQRVWQPMLWSRKRNHRKGPRSEWILQNPPLLSDFFFGSWAFTVFELSCGWKIHCATQRRVWSRMKQLDEQKDTLHIFSDTIRSYSFIFIHFSRNCAPKGWKKQILGSAQLAAGAVGAAGDDFSCFEKFCLQGLPLGGLGLLVLVWTHGWVPWPPAMQCWN